MKNRSLFLWLVTMLASFLSLTVYAGLMAYAPGGRIDDIRTSFNSEMSRVVIESPAFIRYQKHVLTEPNRLVIDIEGVSSFEGIPLLDRGAPLFKGIRNAKRGDGYRVVIDSSSDIDIKDEFQLLPSGGQGFRLVFDVVPLSVPQGSLLSSQGSKPIAPSMSGDNGPSAPAKEAVARDLVIVIDAGHGGKDPGAIGPAGTREKDVVLSISLHLARLINATHGLEAKLTRDDDTFIPLKERTQLARRHQADFFLSLHADAFTSPRPRGPSVFTLSKRGASSESARWLADRENEEALSSGSELLDLSLHDDLLASVLMDLSMTGTALHSQKAGEKVLSSIGKLAKPHKPIVEKANFVVLRSPDIPSLLVEAGFLTNPEEEKLLRDPVYQKKVAKHIYDGLMAYYKKNPPPYSRLDI